MMTTEPKILDRTQTESGWQLRLQVPADLFYFQGHFPDLPILPGVVQLDWAIRLGCDCFGLKPRSRRMEALKFQAVVLPGMELLLNLAYDEAKGKLSFSFESDQARHASGRVVLS
ncbi:hydroxymyristoyl-ACP dehydratase [Gallaecimonas sp. GXIMD4217]|uniref:ApeI family dehydratase n=1 Tax=Gallaecimonas sp. GXIMD4217 TaxID=3131927 RepID=UPI00311AFCF6